jgi:tetratricopeptide (TPR) repeat protein
MNIAGRRATNDERPTTRAPAQVGSLVIRHSSFVLIITLLALGLRLLVWRWREFYPLGGDEQEYLGQALTLLQQHRYVELRLMRPPLYTLFLAGCILLWDSLVQNLRLAQAFVSAATLAPLWMLTREIFDFRFSKIPILACLFMALSYTLAANATELLSETLFLFGLTTLFWLLVRAGRLAVAGQPTAPRWAAAAGLALGLLCLTRSVAQPLLPLGTLWLALLGARHFRTQHSALSTQHFFHSLGARCSLLFALCALLVILPWTARNYLTYGGLILIDTTGAENLWLDNNSDPQGRDGVKAQLYALGEERLLRQRISAERGLAAISGDPARFAHKAWGELLKLFALEYSDDMRARPQIWLPPAEVWARLLLGDALWLVTLLAGVSGFLIFDFRFLIAGTQSKIKNQKSKIQHWADPRWLFVPWALYLVFTAMLFHVELRYRLPLYPALIPYAALALAAQGKRQKAKGKKAWLLPFAFCLLPLILTLLHAPYPLLAWRLGWKHYHLGQAERALADGNTARAEQAAQAALALDPGSALGQVALARVELLRGMPERALLALEHAIEAIPDHPHAHLLRGDLLRGRGQPEQAARELRRFEAASLQDLQAWSWERFGSPPPARLDLGGGLDLGFVRGFGLAEQGGWRWTEARASLRLSPPSTGGTLLLRLASGRPPGVSAPALELLVHGRHATTLQVEREWRTYSLPLAPGSAPLEIELRAETFTPRDYDRASDNGRTLGVMVDWAEVVP